MESANALIDATLQSDHNRRFAIAPASPNEAHRARSDFDLAGVLSHQETRCIRNDHTIQYDNHPRQLLPPVIPDQRGGVAIIEERLDGTTHIRFKNKYPRFTTIKTIPVGQPHPADNDSKVRAPLGARAQTRKIRLLSPGIYCLSRSRRNEQKAGLNHPPGPPNALFARV